MRPPRASVSVDTLRYAAARAVERSSLRKVADEMGMAPSWLDGFIDGRTAAPRSQTLRKLREWLTREMASLAEVSEASAAASLSLLVEGLLTETDRAEARRALLDLLAGRYAEQGALPDWIEALRDPE